MQLIEVISSRIQKGKRLLKFIGFGKDDTREKNIVSSFGDDSNAPKGMISVFSRTSSDSGGVVLGYINVHQLAEVGGKRIYSTNADGSEVKFEVYLRADGTCEIGGNSDNMVRYSKLETAFNDLKSDFNDLVSKYNLHTHLYAGLPPSSTGFTSPTTSTDTPSLADITGARINEIKTS